MNPAIHRELWQKYQGGVPSNANLRHYLRMEKAFNDNAVDGFIEEFRKTLAFAKIDESAIMSPQAEDKKTPDGEQKVTPPAGAAPPAATTVKPLTLPPQGQTQATQSQTVEMRSVPIPLTNLPWGSIQVPYPMTDDAWAELMEYLTLMEKRLKGPLREAKTELATETKLD